MTHFERLQVCLGLMEEISFINLQELIYLFQSERINTINQGGPDSISAFLGWLKEIEFEAQKK